MRKIIWWILNRILFNRKHPHYFNTLYILADRYARFYRNEGDLDRRTNGGWRFLREYLQTDKPKVIFDVGAHVGEYIEKIREFGSDATIYAFEPVSDTYKQLTAKNIPGVIPVNMALSSASGERTIYISSNDNAISPLQSDGKEALSYDNQETIQCSTVDEYAAANHIEHIDLLKIDTEGHDLDVLKGAKNMLRSGKIDTVVFEFGMLNTFSHTYFWDFFVYLTQFGFALYKMMPLGLEKVTKPLGERTIYTYFVAKR